MSRDGCVRRFGRRRRALQKLWSETFANGDGRGEELLLLLPQQDSLSGVGSARRRWAVVLAFDCASAQIGWFTVVVATSKKKKQKRPFEVKQALAAARRVAEAHRTASHVMSQPYDSPGSPSGDDDDDEYEEEEEEIVWARVEADEAEADRKFTSSISTTRSVWDARLKVLKSATAYAARCTP